MDKNELTRRTREFAVGVFRLMERVLRTNSTFVIINQLPRAAASVASNYRAVSRAKSRADFGNKLKIVLEEADECNFWLSFLSDIDALKADDKELIYLVRESNELVAIFAAASKTTMLGKTAGISALEGINQKSKLTIQKSSTPLFQSASSSP